VTAPFNGNIKLVFAILVPLIAAAVGYGTLRAVTTRNDERIAELERKLDERSLSLESTGAGRLILEKLTQIDKRLEEMNRRLERIEQRGP